MTKPNQQFPCPASFVWRLWAAGLPTLFATAGLLASLAPKQGHAPRASWSPR